LSRAEGGNAGRIRRLSEVSACRAARSRLRHLDGLARHKRRRTHAAQRVVERRHGVAEKLVELADLRVELFLQITVEFTRGGKGVINMKTTEKTGKVVAVFPVDEESEMMIITKNGKLVRIEAADIRKTGRSAQGVRLIKTDGDDKVTSASLLETAALDEVVEVTA